jgi:hypothetical protein
MFRVNNLRIIININLSFKKKIYKYLVRFTNKNLSIAVNFDAPGVTGYEILG